MKVLLAGKQPQVLLGKSGLKGKVLASREDNVGFVYAEVSLDEGYEGKLVPMYDDHNHIYYFVHGECEISTDGGEKYTATTDTVLALSWQTQASIAVKEHARIVIITVPRDENENPAPAVFRKLAELKGTDRWLDYGKGLSRRFLRKGDGFNISVHNTTAHPNHSAPMQYLNHHEANYMIRGKGNYTWNNGANRQEFDERDIATCDGVMYLLDNHDAHVLSAEDAGVQIVCVFFPALCGDEVHDFSKDGSFSCY